MIFSAVYTIVEPVCAAYMNVSLPAHRSDTPHRTPGARYDSLPSAHVAMAAPTVPLALTCEQRASTGSCQDDGVPVGIIALATQLHQR